MKPSAYKLKGETKDKDKDEAPLPDTLKISGRRSPGFYVYVLKSSLQVHASVTLHSLGTAHLVAVNAVNILVKNGYVTLDSVTTDTLEVKEASSSARSFRRARMTIRITRTPDFFQKIKEFKAELEEREKQKAETKAEAGESAEPTKQ